MDITLFEVHVYVHAHMLAADNVYPQLVQCYLYISKSFPWKQPLILGYQRVTGGHYVVKRDRHYGLLVSCNSVGKIYHFVEYAK